VGAVASGPPFAVGFFISRSAGAGEATNGSNGDNDGFYRTLSGSWVCRVIARRRNGGFSQHPLLGNATAGRPPDLRGLVRLVRSQPRPGHQRRHRRDEYDLRPLFATPLRDVDTILYRHEVLRDLERPLVADALRRFAQGYRELRQHLTLISNLRYKHNRNGWFLHAVTIYGEALLSLKSDLQRANLNSRGLLAFRDYLADYTASDHFTELIAQAKRIRASLSTVRYCVLVSGLTVRVRRYEEEADYGAEVAQCFDKFRQRAAADYRVAFPDSPDTDHVEAQILDCVARLYPEIFAELDQFCTVNSDFPDQAIKRFDREIQFYLAYLEFINKLQSAGLQFCYPRIATKNKAVHVRDGFDLALAAKRIPEQSPIVATISTCAATSASSSSPARTGRQDHLRPRNWAGPLSGEPWLARTR